MTQELNCSEAYLEQYLYDHPEVLHDSFPGLKWLGRQIKLPSGICDLVGESEGIVYVFELKAVPAQSKDICQVKRYAHCITKHIRLNEVFKARSVILAPGEPSHNLMLECHACDVDLYTVRTSIEVAGGRWNFTAEGKELDRVAGRAIDDDFELAVLTVQRDNDIRSMDHEAKWNEMQKQKSFADFADLLDGWYYREADSQQEPSDG